ncbi:carbohydrate ABC transporter permease [Microvirga aerophila]|jgi:raffinose/stachyose/melibiose transport system permease protein|uniref:Sugar ABC transporter permease n=1 Tax=Microvirga aerophila TaxID=670291 RepID=A0A512BLB6_9HYPH|nr:sugar ABC transporter permease [Microvirga aerophila]GEO12761.1 sugar ABC transporter permease [Microvirga aerophila]
MPVSPIQAHTLKHRSWVAFLVIPPVVFMSLFVVYPILSAFAYAFYEWRGLARGEFVGLANFKEVLFGPTMAPVVWNAFLHNVYALIALMIIQNGGGFLLAWLLYKEPFGYRFHRLAVFVPVVLSTIIVGFLWKLFLNPNFGLVNQALNSVGLDALAKPWLGDSSTALGALILANAWHFIGFPTLVYLAGMQRIPSEIIEAARLDGTNEWQLLKNIVWPLVAPSTTILFTLLFIGAFNWFEIPYVMAGLDGSPFGSTDVLGLVFYRTAFGNQSASIQNFGQGSALATMIFLFIVVFASALTLWLRRREIQF